VSIGNLTVSILAGSNATVNGSYIAKAGRRIIEVRADALNTVAESDESDNNATQNISVPAYQVFFGNLSDRGGIGINNSFFADFGLMSVKNLFVADTDSVINFARLAPLGRKNDSSVATRDFEDADLNLNMSTFNDSINLTFSVDGTNPRANTSFLILESLRANVSFVNSTNSSSFLTGILWDSSDSSSNNEYDTTEKEDLIFFTAVNASQASKFGTVDYVIRLPSLLRHYKGSVETVTLYLEPR